MKSVCASVLLLSQFTTPALAQPDTALIDKAVEAVEEKMSEPGFSGAVIIVHDGEQVFAKATGVANQETGAANTLSTRFNIASVGKFFTAAAMLKVAEDNNIDLDAPVRRFFAEDRPDLFTEAVTLRNLLSHATSAQSYLEAPDAVERMTAAGSNHDLFLLAADAQPAPIDRLTGQLAYSNVNFIIAGEIIERVSGETYEDYIREALLTPAGAERALFTKLANAEAHKLAIGYLPESPGENDTQSGFVIRGGSEGSSDASSLPARYPVQSESPLIRQISSAAGGLYISAEDFGRVAASILNGEALDRELLNAMCAPQVKIPGSNTIFGMGCGGHDYGDGKRRWGHNGGGPGVNAYFAIYPDLDLAAVILSNHDQRAKPVFDAMEKALGFPADGGMRRW